MDDIQKSNNVHLFKPAQKYYSELANRAKKRQIVIDIFAFTLDQFGLV